MANQKKKVNGETIITAVIAIIFIFLIGACTFGTGSSSSSKANDAEVKAMEDKWKANCAAKTDAYHKCSYSAWEGRCVCKTR